MEAKKILNKNKLIALSVFFVCIISATSLFFVTRANAEGENAKDNLATIVFTNDTHSNINGSKTAEGLCYSTAVQIEKDAEANSDGTFLVDAGDHMWASKYSICGPNRMGRDIIDIMRTAHYDLAVPGNHEYEYGQKFFTDEIVTRAGAPESGEQQPFTYYACNYFKKNSKGEKDGLILDPYKMIDIGTTGKKIAFIGIATPESSAPIWDFNKQIFDTGAELQADVQNAINECKQNGANYIVAVAHLGIYFAAEEGGYSSKAVIENTEGLDAVIDGHSHMTYNTTYNDKSGKAVYCVQCGNEFKYIGKMSINQAGNITVEQIETYNGKDSTVLAAETSLINNVDALLESKIANNNIPFPLQNEEGTKITETKECNLGDLISDAIYWTANNTKCYDQHNVDCDFTLINSNLINGGLDAGELKFQDFNKCINSNYSLIVANVTGEQILNALEWSCITDYNPENSCLNPWRNFAHVSGIKYDVNCNIPSTVQVDWTSEIVKYFGPQWIGPPTGDYKVSNVQIYNKITHEYEDLKTNKIYKMGLLANIIKRGTEGFNMIDGSYFHLYDCTPYEAIKKYLSNFNSEANAMPTINSQNSPLADMPNFQINYEDPNGSGRVTFNYSNPQPVQPEGDITGTTNTGDDNLSAIILLCLLITITLSSLVINRSKIKIN